jgi:hypothetical protein
MTEEKNNGSELMSHQDRCEWLRERGVIIETVEDRRRLMQKQQPEPNSNATAVEKILFVRVPWDMSQPLEQCEMDMAESSFSNASVSVDPLSDMLAQNVFSSSSKVAAAAAAAAVDLELLPSRNTTLLSSTGGITVSDESLRTVANRGCCETFRLVPPMSSNSYNAIYAYLDEVGMLKRLPLNKRASDFAYHAGFNPPPKFYGDIYLGRVHYSPDQLRKKNVNFYLGPDTDISSSSTTNGNSYSWLRQATVENLQFHQQQKQNKIDVATSSNEKLTAVGEDGIPKEEGLFSWTQTLEEIELLIPLPEEAEKKQISVVFHPKRIKVLLLGKSKGAKNVDVVDIELYAPIDVDGCTWTFEKSIVEGHTNKVVVTCEKQDGGVTWPRINY